jgi:hypothetical protein
MSRTLQILLVGATAALGTLALTGSAEAGCGRSHFRHYVVHHRPIYHAPTVVHRVVHQPVVVQPTVAIAPPAPPKPELTAVPIGSTLTLPGNFLGEIPGHVFLVMNEVKLPAQINNWTPNGVTITLPPMALKAPTPARIDLILPHGGLAHKVPILLTPPAPVVLHPGLPSPPLPTGVVGPAGAGPAEAAGPQIGAPIVQSALQ